MNPEKGEESLQDNNPLTTYLSQQCSNITLKHSVIVDLLEYSQTIQQHGVFDCHQRHNQDQIQSRIISLSSSKNDNPKHRPRKTLTKDIINQLNEAFKFYEQQPSNSRCCLTDIAKLFQIGYSTILRKYRQFKSHSIVKQGKRLTSYPRSYQKSRLAHTVISRCLSERDLFDSAQEISKYVLLRYGLYYDSQIIRKQLRTIGIRRNQKRQILGRKQSYSCDYCLLQQLMSTNSKMVYFCQSKIVFQQDVQVTIALLSSNFGSKVIIYSKEMEWECISSLKQDFQIHFEIEIKDIWYLTIDEATTYWNSYHQRGENVILHDQQIFNPKIIKICPDSNLCTPGRHLLKEIVSKIQTSGFNLSQTISTLPKWLEMQQEASIRFIKEAELHLLNLDHICPVRSLFF